jgi:hypothetical protein
MSRVCLLNLVELCSEVDEIRREPGLEIRIGQLCVSDDNSMIESSSPQIMLELQILDLQYLVLSVRKFFPNRS